MKIQPYLLLFLSIGLFSCSEDDFGDELGPEASYFYASLEGPSWNEEVTIMGDSMGISSQATITPSGDPEIPSVLFLNYNDPDNGIGVTIRVPAEERLTELTDGGSVFGIGITNTIFAEEEVILTSKSVSVDVTKLKTSGDILGFKIPDVVIANFEGVMIRERYVDGQVIEEAHTVKGDFKYYSSF